MKSMIIAMRDKAGKDEPDFYGSTVVGKRGQIVIPKDARDKFGLKAGDKLILLGNPGKGLLLAKADSLREFAKKLLKKI